ncbi:hypothetical protein NDU88_001790 [Pleurodeles waltl]|uniref:Uncharacterized protein n=1 Tax=Pleurodeles waltl TaxID=8319 RepID=A0AAV7SB25_PLEWA|nr:hypothetical protein NDU88_001790 [Pleurodeles waltl]
MQPAFKGLPILARCGSYRRGAPSGLHDMHHAVRLLIKGGLDGVLPFVHSLFFLRASVSCLTQPRSLRSGALRWALLPVRLCFGPACLPPVWRPSALPREALLFHSLVQCCSFVSTLCSECLPALQGSKQMSSPPPHAVHFALVRRTSWFAADTVVLPLDASEGVDGLTPSPLLSRFVSTRLPRRQSIQLASIRLKSIL